jgi:hypothetical protein
VEGWLWLVPFSLFNMTPIQRHSLPAALLLPRAFYSGTITSRAFSHGLLRSP